ncbi:MAG TPA: DUF4411 family protein, partial [Enhygromyxa sp.]|nr:DUF4411 family protein [Enhygromyxa sp.]
TTTVDNGRLEKALRMLEADLLAGKIIREHYPKPNIRKYMEIADPVLVLHAQLYGHVVVSNELSDKLSKKGPKIPDLCEIKGVAHATPAEFAEVLGYEFGPVPAARGGEGR